MATNFPHPVNHITVISFNFCTKKNPKSVLLDLIHDLSKQLYILFC